MIRIDAVVAKSYRKLPPEGGIVRRVWQILLGSFYQIECGSCGLNFKARMTDGQARCPNCRKRNYMRES